MYLINKCNKSYLTLSKQFDLNDDVYEIKLKFDDMTIIPEVNEKLIPLQLFEFKYKSKLITFKTDYVSIFEFSTKYFNVIKINNSRRSKTLSPSSINEINISTKLINIINEFNAKNTNISISIKYNDTSININSLKEAVKLVNEYNNVINKINNFNAIK